MFGNIWEYRWEHQQSFKVWFFGFCLFVISSDVPILVVILSCLYGSVLSQNLGKENTTYELRSGTFWVLQHTSCLSDGFKHVQLSIWDAPKLILAQGNFLGNGWRSRRSRRSPWDFRRLAGGFQDAILLGAPSVDGFALNIQFVDCEVRRVRRQLDVVASPVKSCRIRFKMSKKNSMEMSQDDSHPWWLYLCRTWPCPPASRATGRVVRPPTAVISTWCPCKIHQNTLALPCYVQKLGTQNTTFLSSISHPFFPILGLTSPFWDVTTPKDSIVSHVIILSALHPIVSTHFFEYCIFLYMHSFFIYFCLTYYVL